MKWGSWRYAALALVLILGGSLLALLLLAFAVDHGALRDTALRFMAWRMGRTLSVRGELQLHLLSMHPTLEGRQVTLGNPAWTPPGTFGTAKHVTLAFRWGRGLDELQLEGTDLDLLRDAQGFANWQFRRPQPTTVPRLPALALLRASDVHLRLNDGQRHLEYEGAVSGGATGNAPLKLMAQGTLNTRPAFLTLTGDPLNASPRARSYGFELLATGSGVHLDLKGRLPEAFETDLIDAQFEARGEDLKDLYFLTGLRFLNTAAFRLSGTLERRGSLSRFTALSLSAGQSDISGQLSVETHGAQPRLDGEWRSRLLRSADFGARAAGRDASPEPQLFSAAALSLAGLRGTGFEFRYAAERLLFGRFELQAVAARLQNERGVVDLPAFEARLLGGRLHVQAHMDARRDQPPVQVHLELQDGELQALPFHTDDPPLTGPVQVEADLSGHGRSLHDMAASVDGQADFHVQHGTIRASIAELAGMDLRGIGLALTHSQRELGLHCAVGHFQAAAGTLNVTQLLADTDTVLIRGEGAIHLGYESLDLRVRGEPKETRWLRLSAPLQIKGTLRTPLITPLTEGAAFHLVDPGHPQHVDCAAG